MAATLRHSGDLTTDADYIDDLRAAAEFIKSKLPPSDLAIVLGSGLQDFEKNLSDTSVVSYADIPGMPLPKVAGHPGRFISGVLPGGRRIYCLAGRSHCYEGYSFLTVAFPPNLLALLGVKIFVATNAAGGGPGTRVAKVEGEAEPVEQMHPGVLMLISDHVNNLLRNPIEEVSAVLDLSEPYLSGASLYSQRLRAIARTTYQQLNQPGSVSLYEGTYACFSGPTYETATEVTSASRSLGINAFGMSTVPDVILARACGLECLAISLVTNMAAGISGASLSHTEVTETGTSAANSFETYMSALLSAIPAQPVVPRDIPPPTAAQAMLTLPRALPRSATAAELGHAASQLRLGLGLATGDEPVVRSALFFGPPHSHPSLVVDADSPTVPVAQLRGFPVFSAAGRKGVVSLRREGGAATLLIDSRDHLGFCTAEANFLVAVLRLLGASHIALLVSAGSSEPTTVPVGSVVAITDYFDVATISAAPVSPHSPLPLVSDPTLPGHTCAFFPGPTYPSAAELAVASRAAITLSAVVHSHLISAAVAAALPLAVVATVDYLAPKAQDGLAAVSSDAATATALEHLRAQLAREQPAPPVLDLTAASLADKYLTLGLHLARPVTQGCLQAVTHDALAVRTALLLGDEDACPPVVLYDRGLPALSDLTILASYDFDLGEGVAADNATCRLSLAESAGHRWLLLQTAAPESSGVPLGTLMHPLRVVASLRPPSVLSVLRLFSTTELQRAQLVPLRDHVNRSGRNPLFGTNIAEWGERFFDVQTLYQSSLRQRLAAAIAKTVGSQPEDTVVCYGLGPFSISPAALRVLGIFTATAWAFSNIPEHLTLHHMGVPLAALGVVITSSDQVVNTQHLKSAITDFFFPTE